MAVLPLPTASVSMANPGEHRGGMTEETGTSPAGAGTAGIDPAAVALALDRTGSLDPNGLDLTPSEKSELAGSSHV
jgi:hypothetical protein